MEERRQIFRQQFHPGRVFRLFCPFTTPQKEKFLFLVCVNPKPLFFVVNSKISEFIQRKKHLLAGQVQIKSCDYEFLSHDSWLDCTQVRSLDIEFIEYQIIQSMDWLKETANGTTVSAVIKAINASKTIELQYKQWILQSLEDYHRSISEVSNNDDLEVPF